MPSNARTRKTTSATPIRRGGAGGASKIHLNLDTLEREVTYEAFTFLLGNEEIVLTDPAELEWEALLDLEDPSEFLELCATDEDRERIFAAKLKGWQLNRLMKEYMTHYGLGDRGKGLA